MYFILRVLPLLLVATASWGVVGCGTVRSKGSDQQRDASAHHDGGQEPDAQNLPRYSDDDNDGFSEMQGDCNDNNPLVVPLSEENCDDGIDNNCNGAIDEFEPDQDADGFGPCNGDCNDHDPDIGPLAQEVEDGIDNNCDGLIDADYDGDGWTTAAGDCDDQHAGLNPDALENCHDTLDNDCNGYADAEEPDIDGDGYGPCNGDCDDENPQVAPNQPEIDGDGVDNNCDNLVDQDIDGDGWTSYNGDCDDHDPTRNPAVREVCSDAIDNDCDGTIDTDCLSPCEMAALLRSSVGCVYYAVDTNPLHSSNAGDYAVAISNIDDTATAQVVIEQKSGSTWSPVADGSFSVGPQGLVSQVLDHRFIAGSALYAGGAYRITSDLPVIVYQFNPLDGATSFFSDASLLLPRSALDQYYLVPAWPYGPSDGQSNSGYPAHIQIVASASTEVRIVSPVTTQAGTDVPALTPHVEASFALDEGDFLQFTIANWLDSFTGTYIESDEPIGVFSSNDCANVPACGIDCCCCEHLEEQILGLQTWGMSYVAARVPRRGTESSIWQILAAENNTQITFDAHGEVTGLPGEVTLNARQSIQFEVNGSSTNPGDFAVYADRPILVTQFMVGCRAAGSIDEGDPSMVQAVPVEQFLDRYVVLVPDTWENDYLVLVRETGATVEVDGSAVTSGWTTVGDSGYQVARVSVPDGVYVLQGSAPFGVVVVGYDSYDSYAYPGGLDQQLINPMN